VDLATALIEAIHVTAAITWLGGHLAWQYLVLPTWFGQPVDVQRELGRSLVTRYERVVIPAALVVFVTGVLRGTMFGRIHTLDDLAVRYGASWAAALVLVLVTFAIGARLGTPRVRAYLDDDPAWSAAIAGDPAALLRRRRAFVRALRLELSVMLAVLALMFVMRFS
jgi:uncharacterized membrane protein